MYAGLGTLGGVVRADVATLELLLELLLGLAVDGEEFGEPVADVDDDGPTPFAELSTLMM